MMAEHESPTRKATDVELAVQQLDLEVSSLFETLFFLKDRLASVLTGSCLDLAVRDVAGECKLSKDIYSQAGRIADLKEAVQFLLDDLKL